MATLMNLAHNDRGEPFSTYISGGNLRNPVAQQVEFIEQDKESGLGVIASYNYLSAITNSVPLPVRII